MATERTPSELAPKPTEIEECCCADALEPIAIESCPPRVVPAVGAVILAPLPIAIDEFPPAVPEAPAKESVPLAVAPAPMAVAFALLLLEL